MNIHQIRSFPYAIAALQKAGMSEADVCAVPLINTPSHPFEEVIDPKRIGHEVKPACRVSLTHAAPSDVAGGYSHL